MIIQDAHAVEETKVEAIGYRDTTKAVTGVSVRWLSKSGTDHTGGPAYGLRLFTIEPGGEIPIHNHDYIQTMYILTGRFECLRFHPETDEVVERVECGPGDAVYIPGLEPHGMKNLSADESGTFLCCICTLSSGTCA